MSKEIYLETDYGADKIRLLLQFPSNPSNLHPADALRTEILTRLSHELFEQLQDRAPELPNQKPPAQEFRKQEVALWTSGKECP